MSTVTVQTTVAEQVEYSEITMTFEIPDDAGVDISDPDAVEEWMRDNESDWVDELDIGTQVVYERDIIDDLQIIAGPTAKPASGQDAHVKMILSVALNLPGFPSDIAGIAVRVALPGDVDPDDHDDVARWLVMNSDVWRKDVPDVAVEPLANVDRLTTDHLTVTGWSCAK